VMGGGCTASGAAGTGILWGVQWDVANQQGYSEEGCSKYIPALVSPQIQVIGDRDIYVMSCSGSSSICFDSALDGSTCIGKLARV